MKTKCKRLKGPILCKQFIYKIFRAFHMRVFLTFVISKHFNVTALQRFHINLTLAFVRMN